MQFSIEAINNFISWFETLKHDVSTLGGSIIDGLIDFNSNLSSPTIDALINVQKEQTENILTQIDSIVTNLKERLAYDSEQMGIQVEDTENALGG